MRVNNPEQYIPYALDGLYSGGIPPKNQSEAFLAGVELATRYFHRHWSEVPVTKGSYPLTYEDVGVDDSKELM